MLTQRNRNIILLLSSTSLCLSLISCKPAEIKQYSVDKEKAITKTASTPNSDEHNHDHKGFSYTTPDNWQEKEASGMRKASFSLAEDQAEVSVISLPGSAGDLKGNVNRWRGQVGLEPIDSELDIIKSLTPTKIDDAEAFLLDLQAPAGKEDSAMHVAFAKREGQSWFFKLSGPLEIIKSEKPAFTQFIQSIKFTEDDGHNHSDTPGSSANDAMNNPMNTQMLGDLPPASTQLSYKAPDDWQKQEAGGMRSASFKVSKDQATADVSVIALSGDGGGVLSNVNRWRDQAGLEPIQENELDKMFTILPVDGHSAYYLSILTDDAESNMLITLIETAESTWFIKMSGDRELLQSQQENYLNFVKSLQFNSVKEQSNG